MSLRLYNTLTRQKEAFDPIDPQAVRMYVCGPTVYDFAHIGNARPVIVFDVLYRLLRHLYPGPGKASDGSRVEYVRNITDVDDKINARAAERYPDLAPEVGIRKLTEETAAQFHRDIAALGVLPPTVEPRATEHIAEMVALCDRLVANGHAYVAADHVLFDVSSMPAYGRLSNRSLEEMEAGARVEVAPYKKGPMDFVLWKPSKPGEPAWPSPQGIETPGRPGWHIECSAMSWKHLGDVFDIHGGGIDLVFPHHENEIAQSCCALGTDVMARVWMHNGFLQVEGEKMSKSLGNFVTINELLETEKFGGRRWPGEVLRLAMLMTHYRQPIDWTVRRLEEAETHLDKWAYFFGGWNGDGAGFGDPFGTPSGGGYGGGDASLRTVVETLCDDLATPGALTIAHAIDDPQQLQASLYLLGIDLRSYAARKQGRKNDLASTVAPLVAARLEARKRKDFKESDRIRDELAAMGVALKDTKNKETGEIETTWELAR